MSSDAHTGLYGIRKPKAAAREISSSNSLAFSTSLSSLLSNNHTSRTSTGRPRPSKAKPDIFTSHNRNTKKRAACDLEDDDLRVRQVRRQDLSVVDDSALHRSKRKLEEKAKVYSALKRGDCAPGEAGSEVLIDFDRKWADNVARGQEDTEHSSEDDNSESGLGKKVEFEDEYGRARIGTKAMAEMASRRKVNEASGAEELDRMSVRPARPSQLIYGDTVQTAAFNPDEPVVSQMEKIARKRDRSMTPPESKHYEADSEIRSKGVGFYSFSKDEATRSIEMDALEGERLETERIRLERDDRKEKRRREIDERRKAIGDKRAKKQADTFLNALTADLAAPEGLGG